jgi:hypothetical protein
VTVCIHVRSILPSLFHDFADKLRMQDLDKLHSPSASAPNSLIPDPYPGF